MPLFPEKTFDTALPHASRWADKEEGEVSDTDSEQSLGKRFRALQQ